MGFERRKLAIRNYHQKMLTVRNLSVRYGVIQALHQISLVVNQGEIVTLIGSNGAGKNHDFRRFVGFAFKPSSGEVTFRDKDLFAIAPHERVPFGLVQVPEGRRIFGTMTVAENLDLGAYARKDQGQFGPANWTRFINCFRVWPSGASKMAGTMSGGEQQMLAVGRALMRPPATVIIR